MFPVKCTAGGENVKRVLLTWQGKAGGGILPTHSREHVNTHIEEEERKKNVKPLKKISRPCPFLPHHSQGMNFKCKESQSFRSSPKFVMSPLCARHCAGAQITKLHWIQSPLVKTVISFPREVKEIPRMSGKVKTKQKPHGRDLGKKRQGAL